MNSPQVEMIPQTDPRSGYLAHKDEIDAAILRVLEGGWYILGQEVAAFEEEFAHYIGVSHAIGVANGTDALELALRACGIQRGDVVFTVSHTAVATVSAIERTGAQIVLVDIDPTTYSMDPTALEDAVKQSHDQRLKAVVPVHLYGYPADLPAILQIAHRYGLRVIEDCAQSHGATLGGRRAGAWGDLSTFSFYPTKNLGALGDGGMVVTNDAKLADQVRCLRQYGWRERYISETPGMNSRLDEIQAAILRVKLRYLDHENSVRAALARLYHQSLNNTSLSSPINELPATHVYHQYVVRVRESRNALQAWLREHHIETAVHYPVPVHLQPAYRERLVCSHSLIHTERAAREVLSLPMFPMLKEIEVLRVAERIVAWQGSDVG